MAASPRALDKVKAMLWSPWGLAGAHSPTQPGTQAQGETGGAWGSFRHSPCPVLLLALIGVLGQGLPAGAVPVRTVGLPNTWQEPALREDTHSREQTLLPLGSLPSQTLTAFDNHVKASQIQLTLSSQARAPQIRDNSYLSSEGDKRVFKNPPQKTREGN